MSEEEAKKVEKKEGKKDKLKYLVTLIIIGFALGVIKGGLLNSVNDSGESNYNTNSSLVDLPERSFSQLTSASINEDAFIPEATELYSYVDLEFKLPNIYQKDLVNTTTDQLVYATGLVENEGYLFKVAVEDLEQNVTIEDYLNAIENNLSLNGYDSEILSNRSSEKINGKEWYMYKIKHTSTTDNQIEYVESYLTEYNGKLYDVEFSILRDDNVTPNYDNARNFGNIKNSLNFK